MFFLGPKEDPKTLFTEMLVELSNNRLLKHTKQNIKCVSILKINNWDIRFQNTTAFSISSWMFIAVLFIIIKTGGMSHMSMNR